MAALHAQHIGCAQTAAIRNFHRLANHWIARFKNGRIFVVGDVAGAGLLGEAPDTLTWVALYPAPLQRPTLAMGHRSGGRSDLHRHGAHGMSTRNPWLKFQRLLQGEGRAVLTVVSNNGDGTSTVQTRNGVQIKVKGEGLGATAQAMIEGGELRYEVPSLASSVVEV